MQTQSAIPEKPIALRTGHGIHPVLHAFRPDLRRIGGVGSASVLATGAGIADAFVWRWMLQAVVSGTGVFAPVALLGANLLFSQALRARIATAFNEIGFDASRRIGSRLFERLQLAPKSYLQATPNADVQSLLMNDVPLIRTTFSGVGERLLLNGLAIASTVIGMALMSPALTLVMLVPLTGMGVASAMLARRSQSLDSHQNSAWARVMETVQERLSPRGAVATRHYERTPEAGASFASRVKDHAGSTLDALRFRQRSYNMSEQMYSAGMLAGALLVGAQLVGGIPLATFVAFFSLSARLYMPVTQLPNDIIDLQRGIGAARRISTVLDTPVAAIENENGVDIGKRLVGRGIELQNVTFSYPNGRTALRNVTMSVMPGQHVSLTGPTGHGKSTLIDLMTGEYMPTSGRILVNGVDVTDVRRQSMRQLFGIAEQVPTFFTGTIYDNLREADPQASKSDVHRACHKARLHDEIVALPQGYDTLITGDSGLSGGQRQRLQIAKTFLRNAPVLILDEPTSALDARTAAEVNRSLRTFAADKTVIRTSHRPQDEWADLTYVVRNGSIADSQWNVAPSGAAPAPQFAAGLV